MKKPPVILAIDVPDVDVACQWISATSDFISIMKLGLEFFIKCGPEGVREVQDRTGIDLFLDLKLHDIPNTVGKAASSAALLKPKFLTVHASGGRAMIEAAVNHAPEVNITAVTVLTSLSLDDLESVGFADSPLNVAVKLSLLAKTSGARAIVCSPHEAFAIRETVGESVTIITPGVRPLLAGGDDQQRTMTPTEAIKAGANFVVVGRPITGQWENGADAMRRAAAKIAEELD